jgi:hypothetical protein
LQTAWVIYVYVLQIYAPWSNSASPCYVIRHGRSGVFTVACLSLSHPPLHCKGCLDPGKQDHYKTEGICQQIARSNWFENLTLTIIAEAWRSNANCVLMSLETILPRWTTEVGRPVDTGGWGNPRFRHKLVGGLEHLDTFGLCFHIWEFHHPNWRTPSFFKRVETTNQDIKFEYNEHISVRYDPQLWKTHQLINCGSFFHITVGHHPKMVETTTAINSTIKSPYKSPYKSY